MPVSLVLANCFRTKFWENVYLLIEGEIERISNTPCIGDAGKNTSNLKLKDRNVERRKQTMKKRMKLIGLILSTALLMGTFAGCSYTDTRW